MPTFPNCSFGPPARLFAAVVLFGVVATGSALAQTDADPVLAKVNGQAIHFSDLKAAAETLPPQARTMPPQQLYPMLLDQLIDAQALLVEAKKTGLDKDPDVQRTMQFAQDRALEHAALQRSPIEIGAGEIDIGQLRVHEVAALHDKPGQRAVARREGKITVTDFIVVFAHPTEPASPISNFASEASWAPRIWFK